MIVRSFLPPEGEVRVEDLIDRLSGVTLPPFAPETDAAGQRLADRLFHDRDLARDPAATSLAFWLRRTHTRALADAFRDSTPTGAIRLPRGLAFHVAPANVETMFVYSWWLSMLCGNATLVRVPRRLGAVGRTILGHMAVALDPVTAAATAIVGYDHDDDVNRRFSAAADLRVVWGGDATVAAFRGYPLRPSAVEVVFPDRQSLAVIDAGAYSKLSDDGRDDLVRRFLADIVGFGQQACSSPRALVWVGARGMMEEVSPDFRTRLKAAAPMGDDGSILTKATEAARAVLDGVANSVDLKGGGVTVMRVAEAVPRLPDAVCGEGFLFELSVPDLAALGGVIDSRVQTLSYFGFSREKLAGMIVNRGRPGPDRMVPIGRALEFSHLWDGQDMLAAFTRTVTIEEERLR